MAKNSILYPRLRAIAGLGALVGVLLLSGCGQQQEPPPREHTRPVKTMVLGEAGATTTRRFPGQVRAYERVEMAFQVSGRLVKLPAVQGSSVKRGALIAKLDPRDFDANLKSAQAQFDEARANFERAEELIKRDFISKSDYDRLKARLDTTAADMAKAKKALEDSTLRAPFAGVVARRYVENFQEVRVNDPIVSLQDTAVIEVVVNAPERLVARKADIGDLTMIAIFDSFPGRTFNLDLKEFATRADPRTQTFEYVLKMPQPEGANILPGMTATVVVTAQAEASATAERAVFVIPAVAIIADESGASHVWIVDQQTNRVQRRPVVTGELTGTDRIQVVDGLFPGEVIATAGVTQLREDMQVRPVDTVEF